MPDAPAGTPPEFPGIDITVPFAHVDLFGHVNHARYLEYMEQARFAWCAHMGLPAADMIRQGFGPAVVRAQISWRRECRMGDQLRVTAIPLSARRGIGRVRQEIWRGGELCADGELSFVMLHLTDRKILPLPEIFLRSIPPDQTAGTPG